jgi:hypothetical protein
LAERVVREKTKETAKNSHNKNNTAPVGASALDGHGAFPRIRIWIWNSASPSALPPQARTQAPIEEISSMSPELKVRIREGIEFLSLNSSDPYRYWHDRLFDRVCPSVLEEVTKDVHFVLAQGLPGVWNMIEQSKVFEALPSDFQNVISKVNLLSRLYGALVYPRDTVMSALVERLPRDSAERLLCTAYFTDKASEYWHIRNAVAHGHVDFCDETDEAILIDRSWRTSISCRRLLLDSLIVADIMATIFERVRGMR